MCVKKQKTDRSWYDMENGGQEWDIVIREYQTEDVTAAITIWNQVLEDSEEILFLQQKPDLLH